MKTLFATTALTGVLMASSAAADPAFSLGLSFSFGGGQDMDYGVSARILSSDERNTGVAMAGVTYYFNEGNIGVDAGVGYNFEGDHNVGFTYDFLNGQPVLSLNYVQLAEEERSAPPVVC